MVLRAHERKRLDLAGEWQLAFDPAGEGLARGWTTGNWPTSQSDTVQVPAIWNVTHPDAEGVGFYRKTFTLPADWAGQAILLRFGGASYRTEVWLNGSYVGSHEGAYTPFWFDVTSLVRPGADNEVVVRVAALSKTRDVDGMVLRQCPASKQSWYYTYGGLWGEVYLEAVPLLSCRSAFVEPDLRQETALVEVALRNAGTESRPAHVHLGILAPDGHMAAEQHSSVTVPPGLARFAYQIMLPHPLPWSCETPNLYRLRAEVSGEDGETDGLATTFGMRDFTVHNGQFFLNGEPIFLRGGLLQPNYPVTLVAPPDRDMMVREITLLKEAGFNLIRAHIRPAPPGYLDLTDQMGMLVYAEACLAWIRDSPRLLDHGRREIEAMIQRDRNHPSVVFWGIYNENRAASALTSDDLTRFTRGLDTTRVVVDNSGGTMAIDQDFGWVDRATVVPSRETTRQPIQDLHIYVGSPVPGPVYEWMRTLGVSDPPVDMAALDFGSPAVLAEFYRELRSYQGKVFVSELGCGGMSDLDDTVARFGGRDLVDAREMAAFRDSLHEGFSARHLDRVFGSVHNLILATQDQQAAGNTRQTEALLANPRISGYVLTQANDVAWEFHAGLLDLWRNPKRAYHAAKRLNQPHCLILKATTPVVACSSHVPVALTLVDRASPPVSAAEVVVTAYDPGDKVVATARYAVPAGTGIKELGTVSLDVGSVAGRYRVAARLVAGTDSSSRAPRGRQDEHPMRAGAGKARGDIPLAPETTPVGGEEMLADTVETVLVLPAVEWGTTLEKVRWLGDVPDLFKAGDRPTKSRSRLSVVARPASLTGSDWDGLLSDVRSGQRVVVGPLHKRDAVAMEALTRHGLNLRLHYGIGNWMGCYHWIPSADLFAGLPAGGLAGEEYADVLPWYVMSELGGDILAGSLRNTQTRQEPPAILWYSDIEAIRFGQGVLVFCQYRIFDQAGANPLAARLVCNLIGLATSPESFSQS